MQNNKKKFSRRAAARPDEMLDAACVIFIEKGFAAARVEDIATLAGVSKGSVYRYFPSKHALMEGLVTRSLVPMAQNSIEMIGMPNENPRELIGEVLRSIGMHFKDKSVLAVPKLIMREAATFPDIAQMYREKMIDQSMPVFAGLIKKGISQGHFVDVDPQLTVRSIVGPLVAHVLMSELFAVESEMGVELDQLIENHLKILFDGLSAPEHRIT